MHGEAVVDGDLLGVAAAGEQPHDAIAGGEAFDGGPGGDHFAGEFEPEDLELGLAAGLGVTAAPLHEVRAVEGGGADPDEEVLGAGNGVRDFPVLEDVRFGPGLRQDDGVHGASVTGRAQKAGATPR